MSILPRKKAFFDKVSDEGFTSNGASDRLYPESGRMPALLLRHASIALATALAALTARADATWEHSVQVSAQVQASPPRITLVWPQDTRGIPDSYTVYRKAPGAGSWSSGTILPGTTTSFTDTGVTAGTIYEYQVFKTNSFSAYSGYGYIWAGINAPLVEDRGKILLVVDNTYASGLATELGRLQQDLAGDGWTVVRRDVARNDSVVNVKNVIRAEYNADPANLRALFLFGHVPVPYSGELSPDGHLPEHHGAWPADAFYGDMDGLWTDALVASTVAESSRNWNMPNDGKFDPSSVPSPVELQLGRVDLSSLSAFSLSEMELLRRYLNKDHNYRHKQTWLPLRGLVHDSLGIRNGQAYAATSWRSYAPLLGPANVTVLSAGQWFPTLATQGYVWAHGCGAGTYSSISGLGNSGYYNEGTTWDFAATDTRAAFHMLCGSWLGDWDSPNNFMRAALATANYGLASFYAGLPHWFMHPMGLGETLGYCTRLTQNNGPNGLYQNQRNRGAGQVHIALMGDPTLRMYPIAPASALSATMTPGGVSLSWTASADSVLGYHVYRAATAAGPFARLTGSPVSGTTYTDTAVTSGTYTYMVRAIKLESTPSGTFFNSSQGIFETVSGVVLGLPWVTVSAADGNASEAGPDPGIFRISRSGNTATELTVYFSLSGTAVNGTDYGRLNTSATIPSGAASVDLVVGPIDDSLEEGAETVVLTLSSDPANMYAVGSPNSATVSIADNDTQQSIVVWVDDALPAGAWSSTGGGDAWQWVSSNPGPFSGTRAHQSTVTPGIHYHYFSGASATLTVNPGDVLVTYVFLDPSNAPREILLQWYDGSSWAHAAYWGDNLILWGTDGTASQRPMGALPPAGQWIKLEIPASLVGLEGRTLTGMNFILYDGRATWDYSGKSTSSSPPPPPPPSTTVVWVEDNIPAGAWTGVGGGDVWQWVSSNPAPFSGSRAHQSSIAVGTHYHYFSGASATLTINPGDILFTYVFLDPLNAPREIMMQWFDGSSWAHGAYWGANLILWGTDGTASQRPMGALPPAGQWARLEVPASMVALEGRTVTGMNFILYDGRATWDYSGKGSP
ncbi:MAG: hypothetical protein HY735_29880 [Verrucomicrobia bacterium]|nr:hypothetical protein [Verrucomicrobiota bacterium]